MSAIKQSSDIPAKVARQVCVRSVLLETLWNYHRMQNVGFLFCLYPALKAIYKDLDSRSKALVRHQEKLNTHPAMSTLLAGVTARLEHDMGPERTMAARKRLMAVLAAWGDRIFWGHLKPLASTVGVFAAFLAGSAWIACILALAVYNAPQFVIKVSGFGRGWRRGLRILEDVGSRRVENGVLAARKAGALFAGMVAGAAIMSLASRSSGPQAGLNATHAFLGVGGAVVIYLLLRLKAPAAAIVYGAVGSVLAAWLLQ